MAPQEFAPETLTQFVLSIADREGHEARSRNDFRNKGLFEHVSVKAYGIAATVIRIGSPLPKVLFGLAKATHKEMCHLFDAASQHHSQIPLENIFASGRPFAASVAKISKAGLRPCLSSVGSLRLNMSVNIDGGGCLSSVLANEFTMASAFLKNT